jgi:hypothetical protein
MRGKRAILLAFAMSLAYAGTTDSALAQGTYQVRACNAAPGSANNSWVWATNDLAQPSHYAKGEVCPYTSASGEISDQQSGLSTTDALELSSAAQPGTYAGWTFNASTGTDISALTYERYIGHELDPFNDWSPALRIDGSVIATETCADTSHNGETCAVGGPPGQSLPETLSGLTANQLELGLHCQAPPGAECVTGGSQHQAWATMYGATVTVTDPTPPTLGTPTGGLWAPGSYSGFHRGTETVLVAASDLGGGSKNITLNADGKPVATYSAPCDYTHPQPCPTETGPQTLTLPTTTLTDGTHTISLTATDAANNTSNSPSTTLLVDNTAPLPPLNLKVTPNAPGSSTFTATWNNPPGQTAPITAATYQLCSAAGGQCQPATLAPPTGPVTVTLPAPGQWTLNLWLTDAAGNSTPTNAGRLQLTVPALTSTNGSTERATIRLQATLRRRALTATITGTGNQQLKIHFTARLHNKTVATGTRTGRLVHSKLTEIFRLGPRTAAHAKITISAKLGSQPLVSTRPSI